MVDKQKLIEALTSKEEIEVRMPISQQINSSKMEMYFVEILDCVSAYFEPICYGIWKEDILDYLGLKDNMTFGEFLHYKRYIAYKEDFEDLYIKYFSVDVDDNVTLYICDTNYHEFENAIKERVVLEELVKRFGR